MDKISTRDFFKVPTFSNYSLSPDGKHLACLKIVNYVQNLIVINLETFKEVNLSKSSEYWVSSFQWINNEKLWFLSETSNEEVEHLYIVDLIDKKPYCTTVGKKVNTIFASSLTYKETCFCNEDVKNVIEVIHNKRTLLYFDLYFYNFVTKRWTLVIKNITSYSSFLTNKKQQLIYRVKSGRIESKSHDEVEKLVNDKWVTIKTFSNCSKFIFKNLNSDGTVLVLTNIGRDKIALYKYQPNLDETTRELIFEDNDVDVKNLILNKKNCDQINAITFFKDYFIIKWFNKAAESEFVEATEIIKKKYPQFQDSLFKIISFSENRDKLIFQSYSDNMMREYFLYDAIAKRIEILNYKQSLLNVDNLSKMMPISLTTRDNFEIHGYLTTPKGGKKPFPFVIIPHAFSSKRNYWEYDFETQFFANRGYAVLQINFRGSKGYGKKYYESGVETFAKNLHNDITDAVLWVIKNGYAIKNKIALHGIHLGGYASSIAIAREPNLYAVVTESYNMSDLLVYWYNNRKNWHEDAKTFEEALDYQNKIAGFENILKNRHFNLDAPKTKTKALLVPSEDKASIYDIGPDLDQQLNIIENMIIENKINAQYFDVEKFDFNKEDDLFKIYDEIEKFLAKYLKVEK